MASIILPATGTKYGPCKPAKVLRKNAAGQLTGDCTHIDCARTRSDAALPCPYCKKPL